MDSMVNVTTAQNYNHLVKGKGLLTPQTSWGQNKHTNSKEKREDLFGKKLSSRVIIKIINQVVSFISNYQHAIMVL